MKCPLCQKNLASRNHKSHKMLVCPHCGFSILYQGKIIQNSGEVI